MKKGIGLIVVVCLVLVSLGWGVSAYNGIVNSEEKVNSQWGNVQNQYQRRTDLVPNLVNTVKGYAEHEKSTLEGVINARAKATQQTIDPTNLTPEKLQEFQAAQSELSSAIGRLLVSVERYPELKANENFLDLQKQLEGTENRISTERNRFNEGAKEYNVTIRRFPKSIIASMFGFEKKPYFQAEAGAEKAPAVQF